MTRDELIGLLGPYFDGELSDDRAKTVAAALDDHPDLALEVESWSMLRTGLREPILAESSAVSFDGLWAGIDAALDAEQVAAKAPLASEPAAEAAPPLDLDRVPSLWDTIVGFFNGSAWGPGLAFGAAAALVGFIAFSSGMFDSAVDGSSGGEGPAAGPTAGAVAAKSETGATDVAPKGPDVQLEQDNTAWVSSVQYDSGFVVIDQHPEDPSLPLIVWHVQDPTDSDGAMDPDAAPNSQGG